MIYSFPRGNVQMQMLKVRADGSAMNALIAISHSVIFSVDSEHQSAVL